MVHSLRPARPLLRIRTRGVPALPNCAVRRNVALVERVAIQKGLCVPMPSTAIHSLLLSNAAGQHRLELTLPVLVHQS